MSSGDKKDYEKPELLALGSAEEALAYYSARGMQKHVEAVRRMVSEARQKANEPEYQRRRLADGR